MRSLLRAARSWRVAPTVFIGQRLGPKFEYDTAGRAVRAVEWIETDTDLALALEEYEAGLCPGGNHVLAETSKPEHEGAYAPDGPPICCYLCDAQALNEEIVSKRAERTGERTAGLMFSFALNPEVVEQNRQPIPPLPPELQVESGHGQ